MEEVSLKSALLDAGWRVLQHILPTKPYLRLRFLVVFKKRLNLEHPAIFSEKLQWLKLYGNRPEYTTIVDKILVKEYVSSIIGKKYIIPTLGIWNSPREIDFEALPNQFVLKCNHDSGNVFVCKDKSSLDKKEAVRQMRRSINHNYYLMGRETPYKFVKRKVFAEQFMQDEKTSDIRDYKFFCFDGVPKIMLIGSERSENVKIDFFDMEFNHLDIRQGADNSSKKLEKPFNFDLMKDISRKLSNGIPFVRIDLYEINNKVYFGEMTFYPTSGFVQFEPEGWNQILGNWLVLPTEI